MQGTVLLTGSNGLLGQKIVQKLSRRTNIQLVASSKGSNRHPLREGYTYRSCDLTDPISLSNLFEEVNPQAVIHAAAMTQVDYCEENREACELVNVEAVKNIVSLCEKHQAHLHHISTDFIFDGTKGPYKEEDTPKPVNFYGWSKLSAEQIITESNIPHSILRTMLLYGVTPSMSRSNIVLWARESLINGKAISVVGDQYRCPTLVEDLSDATISALMRQKTGIFHISGPEMMTIYDLVCRVADYWKCDKKLITKISSEELGQKAMRPPITGFIILKAQTELAYKPHSLEQGFQIVDRQLLEYSSY